MLTLNNLKYYSSSVLLSLNNHDKRRKNPATAAVLNTGTRISHHAA